MLCRANELQPKGSCVIDFVGTANEALTFRAMARNALLILAASAGALKPTRLARRRIMHGAAAALITTLPMAAVAQEKGLSFGEAIGKELGIVDGKKVELPAILSDKPFKNMKCTPSAWRQCPDQAAQSPAARGNKETEDQLANKFTRRRAQLQIEKAGGSLGDAAPDAPKPPPVEATSKAQGLPEPWVEVTDEKTGKIYYGNTKTGETQFARPE